MSYLLSPNVEVFPSTRRTFQGTHSRLVTEDALSGLIRGLVSGEGFVSSPLRSNYSSTDVFIFNIHGYYFATTVGQLTQVAGIDNTEVYATITLDPGTSTTYTELKGADIGSYYTGVDFTTTAQSGTDRYCLHLLHKDGSTWMVPQDSLIKFSVDDIDITEVDGGVI